MNNKDNGTNRNFKQGMYNSIVIVIVIAIVILLNLFVGQLDIKIDLTKENIYTLTDETIALANELEDEIQIYFLAKENTEYEVLQNVINEYGKLPHITTQWKDPELYPQFASQYTDSEITGNDVIVVNKSNNESKFIPFEDMYIQDYSINYSTYNYDYNNILDAEGQITSAIQYVTSGVRTKMYVVTAHGETPIETKVSELIAKANVVIEEFDVKSATAVPEDCDILMMNGPVEDITDDELTMYKDYLDKGGKAMFSVAYTPEPTDNYKELIEYYGVNIQDAIVCEQEGYFLQNYPTYLLAGFVSVTDEISADYDDSNFVIAPVSKALSVIDSSELRSTLTVKQIVASSEESFAKINAESETIEKEEGDLDGPFDVVVQASDTYKGATSKVVIFASPFMFKDDFVDYYSNSNGDLLIDSIDWMKDGQESSIELPQRNVDDTYLEVPMESATLWGIITIIVVPLCFLIVGFIVWFLRRQR